MFCIFLVKRRYSSGKAAPNIQICKQSAPNWANHSLASYLDSIWHQQARILGRSRILGTQPSWSQKIAFHHRPLNVWIPHLLSSQLYKDRLYTTISTVRVICTLTASESRKDYSSVSSLCYFPEKSHWLTQNHSDRMTGTAQRGCPASCDRAGSCDPGQGCQCWYIQCIIGVHWQCWVS